MTPDRHDIPIIGDFYTKAEVDAMVAEAVEEAKNFADKDDIILVTGSLFVAAEAREFVKNISPEIY